MNEEVREFIEPIIKLIEYYENENEACLWYEIDEKDIYHSEVSPGKKYIELTKILKKVGW